MTDGTPDLSDDQMPIPERNIFVAELIVPCPNVARLLDYLL